MSERIVIRFQNHGDCCQESLEAAPVDVPGPNKPEDVSIPPLTGDPRSDGKILLELLRRQPAISQALDAVTPRDESAPIYLQLEDGGDELDALPWEVLFHPSRKFLSLSNFWPVVRSKQIFNLRDLERDVCVRRRRTKIRLLAVLAAAGADWRRELCSFEKASLACSKLACDLEVILFHSARGPVTSAAIAPDRIRPFTSAQALWDAIAEFSPNILHFFCHGSVANGPQLHCARVLYHDQPIPENMVTISPECLQRNLPLSQSLWMVVLNACSTGAAAGENQHSFARELLSPQIPLVLANRVPVEERDASILTERLYPSLAQTVRSHARSNEAEWSGSLLSARNALVNLPTAAQDAWSRPMLYAVPNRFRFHPVATADPEDASRRETVDSVQSHLRHVGHFPDGILGSLPPGTERLPPATSR